MEKLVKIQLDGDLEARPLAMLVQIASQFDSSVYLESEGKKVNAKSIMGMMSLTLKKGDDVLVKVEIIQEGEDLSIIAIGRMVERAKEVAELIPEKSVEIINARFLKPLDEETILKSINKTKNVITIEDNLLKGGLGSAVIELLNKNEMGNIKVKTYGYNDIFVEHGKVEELEKKYNINAEKISKTAMNIL